MFVFTIGLVAIAVAVAIAEAVATAVDIGVFAVELAMAGVNVVSSAAGNFSALVRFTLRLVGSKRHGIAFMSWIFVGRMTRESMMDQRGLGIKSEGWEMGDGRWEMRYEIRDMDDADDVCVMCVIRLIRSDCHITTDCLEFLTLATHLQHNSNALAKEFQRTCNRIPRHLQPTLHF